MPETDRLPMGVTLLVLEAVFSNSTYTNVGTSGCDAAADVRWFIVAEKKTKHEQLLHVVVRQTDDRGEGERRRQISEID